MLVFEGRVVRKGMRKGSMACRGDDVVYDCEKTGSCSELVLVHRSW